MSYYIQLPDGRDVEFPDNYPRAQAQAIAARMMAPSRQEEPVAEEQPRARTNVFRDVPGSLVSGVGGLGTAAGGLYGLVSGDFDNVATRAGRYVQGVGRDIMSPGLRQQQDEFEQRMRAVENEGLGTQALTAVQGLASNPYLLGNQIVEQAPQLAASLGIGRAGAAVGQVAARRAGVEAGEQAARRGAQTAAIGGATGLQTGEVATSTYDEVMRLPQETISRSPAYQELRQTMTDQDARNALATRAAREAAAIAAPLSAASATLLPGVERMAFAERAKSAALSRIIGGFLAEGAQEGIEEGGGRFGQNVGASRADVDRNLMQGVGSAAASGAIVGGTMGGAFAGLRGRDPSVALAGEDPDLRRALNQFTAAQPSGGDAAADIERTAEFVSQNLPVTAEQFLSAPATTQERLLRAAQRNASGPINDETRPAPGVMGDRGPQSGSAPNDETVLGQAGSFAQGVRFEEGRDAPASAEDALPGETQAQYFRRRAEEQARASRPAPASSTNEDLLRGIRGTQAVPPGTATEQTIRAAQEVRASQEPLSAFFPLVEGYIDQHVRQYGPSQPVSIPAFQTYVRERTGQIMPLAQAREVLSTYNDPAPPTERSVPTDQGPAFPAINPRAKAKPRPIERPVSPAPGQGFVLDETGRPTAPRGPTTDEDGRPLWRSRQDLSSISAPTPASPTGFADPRLSQLSAREAEAAQQEAPQPTQQQDAARAAARRVIDDRLEKLSKRGKQGKAIRDELSRRLEDGRFNADQLYGAFMAADQIAAILPAGADHRIEFVDQILIRDPNAAAASGNAGAQEAQGERVRPGGSINRARFTQLMREGMTADRAFATAQSEAITGIIRLSLASNQLPFLRETAAHEAFHVLQDYYGKYDPQFAKLMNQGFRDGMMITDIDPTIRRKLEQTRYPNSDRSYWQVLTATLPNELTASEAQAYAFGSLVDAAKRGTPMSGLKPAFARFVNFLRQFFTRMGNALRGDGFQTVEDVLGRVAQGDARRFDDRATPTARDFPQQGAQLSARRFPGMQANGDHIDRVSQRVPTAVKATEDPITQNLSINLDTMKRNPKAFARNVSLVENYPNFKPDDQNQTPEEKAKAFEDHVVRNLLWLFDRVPADVRDRSKQWYVGARKIAERTAEQYGMTDRQAAGVLAVLSPQKDWFQNVSLAERTTNIFKTKQNFRAGKKMNDTAERIFAGDKYEWTRQLIRGKTLAELNGMNSPERLGAMAMWVRVYDETFNPRSYASVTPEGEMSDPVLTGSGNEAKVAWGSLTEIAKGITIIESGSRENISENVGGAHKVRNFFNNILAPNAPHGDVTIDTHAVAAALLRPLAGASIEVAHGLGTSPGKGQPGAADDSINGTRGLYGLYADAYRRAATERGVLPREMQSITWEAVRGLFTPVFKRNRKSVAAADQIWYDYRSGNITEEQAREQIEQLAGGVRNPSWFTGEPGIEFDEGDQGSSDAGELRGAELGQRDNSSPTDRRAVGRGAGRAEAEGRLTGGAQSLAQKIQLSARQTNTSLPEFTNWWNGGWRGDGAQAGVSVAANLDGSPKVFYHGTPRSFRRFDKARSGSVRGETGPFFFTDDPDFATDYAESDMSAGGRGMPVKKGSKIYPVYLSAQNPFDYQNPEHVQAVLDAVVLPASNNSRDAMSMLDDALRLGMWRTLERPEVQRAIRSLGFDGFFMKENGFRNLAIYDPRQVKSIFNSFEQGAATNPQFSARTTGSRERKDVTGRDPVLTQAAQDVRDGKLSRQDYEDLVNERRAVRPYDFVPEPATEREIRAALKSDQQDGVGRAAETLEEGHPVGLRLDIPAYTKNDTWVVSVHEQEAGFKAGTVVGYEPVAAVTGPVAFGVVPKAAMSIAAGTPKGTIAVVKGNWSPITPEEAVRRADAAMNDPAWTQVGMDPYRHSYFYDRKTMEPVVGADEAIQIGPLVLAKNPIYASKENYQFSARSPLSDDITYQNIGEKITGKELDKPNVFRDGLRRFFGALPGEKLSSALVRTTVNRAAPLWMLDRLAKEKGLSLKSAGLAMEVALNNSGRVQMYLEHGPLAYDPKTGDVTIREDVPGLIEAVKGRLNVQDKKEAQRYLVALRERDLRKNGRQGFLTLSDAEVNTLISKAEAAHPEWKGMAADIQRINKALLDFAVATGTLERSKADELGAMFYTPFYRRAEEDAKDENNAGSVIGPRVSDAMTNMKTAFDRKLEGGKDPLGDLFENMIRNADMIMKAGMKNIAMRQAAEVMEGVGLGREVKKRETGKTITYRVNGQDKHFEVDDAVLYTTLAGAPREFTQGIYQTMANMAGFFRDMITAAPSFMLANLWRGKTMAYVQEGVPFYTNTFNGLRQAMKASTSYKAISAQTGFGGYTYGMGERDAAKAFEREIAGLGYGPGGLMRRALSGLQKVSEATEMAERIKLYERMKAQGMTDKEAAYQAYLLAPFSRRGMGGGWVGTSVNWLVPLVPFLNAKIQGMYRLVENEKGDALVLKTIPKQMFLRGLVVMGASLALAAKNMADEPERWDNETPDLKFRYDILYLPDGNRILLPRAFEVGSVFGALPVFIMDAIRREDGRDIRKVLTDIGTSTFFFNPIPQALLPILGATTNYDFFRGRALEAAGDLSKLPEERVNRNTSTVARLAGEAAGISPIRIQSVLEGYSGTIGTSVLAGFDTILASMGLIPNKPAGAFGDPASMPAIIAGLTGASRFYRSDDQTASRFVGDFYKIKEQVEQLNRSFNQARNVGDQDRLAQLRGEEGLPLQLRPMVNAASQQLSNINEQMRRLERQGLSSEELAERLKPLRERRDQVTRRVVERARQLGL